MPVERSAGAMVFRKEGGSPLFLLLRYPSTARAKREYWDLPKGHIEKGEKEIDTVVREVREETGLDDIELIPGFKIIIKYFFKIGNKKILKFVSFYLAKTQTKKIEISEEHLGFKWLPYNEALKQLTFKNAKDILKEAYNFISKKSL